MLGQRLRRWSNIEPTLDKCTMFERTSPAQQQTQNICITFIQRRPNVFDIGSTLYKVLQCVVFTSVNSSLGSDRFDFPAGIQSVCLQANAQVGAGGKDFELITHRCRSSIYELAVI